MLRRRGIDPGEAFLSCFEGGPVRSGLPPGVLGVAPLEDLASVVHWSRARSGADVRSDNPAPSPSALLRSFARSYAARPALDVVTQALIDDRGFAVPVLRQLWTRLLAE